jgi:exodeoxyribonuclease VII large subunit
LQDQERLYLHQERLKNPQRLIAGFRLSLDDRGERLLSLVKERISREKQNLPLLSLHLRQAGPLGMVRSSRPEIDILENRLNAAIRRFFQQSRKAWALQATLLESLSPLAVLSRGYGIVRTLPHGRIVRNADVLSPGDSFEVQVFRGRFRAVVERIFPE